MITSQQFRLICALALLPFRAQGAPAVWNHALSPHFELITDTGERQTAGLVLHLEQLWGLLPPENAPARTRIIAFRAAAEFEPYRLGGCADAYYAGAPGRDYIVLPFSGPGGFRLAAHEYAHLVANHAGTRFPPWLAEGLAEVLSTVRFEPRRAVIGRPDPARLRMLQRPNWLPLAAVMAFDLDGHHSREERGQFYAESWALVHMLMFSPAYGPRFRTLSLEGGRALPATPDLESDLRAWVTRARLPSLNVEVAPTAYNRPVVTPLSATAVELELAALQLVIGRYDQARAAYLLLEPELPRNPEIQAALGRIALEEGNTVEGRERFHRAIRFGIRDARLCYEYAMLAQDAGLPKSDILAALERALELDPGLDDARYALALEHMHTGRAAEALEDFRGIRVVPERRAFAYYAAVSDVQNELGLREEAAESAAQAGKHARSEEEAAQAKQLAWMAESEVVVQMSGDGSGKLRRIPRGNAGWNPFIEAGDHIERREGELREVDCSGGSIRLTVLSGNEPLHLEMPDPGRVQVRKHDSGIFEFTCGVQQDGLHVLVEYAAMPGRAESAGVVRGLELLR